MEKVYLVTGHFYEHVILTVCLDGTLMVHNKIGLQILGLCIMDHGTGLLTMFQLNPTTLVLQSENRQNADQENYLPNNPQNDLDNPRKSIKAKSLKYKMSL